MIDYKNGKIYQIVCNETGEIYVGSTVQDLEIRLRTHKTSANACCSKQIIDRNNYYIELLETYPCNSQFELDRKEGEYQRVIECINHRIAGRTRKEWEQDNKEALAKNKREYYQNNKEALAKNKREYYQNNKETFKARDNKVVICECGIESTKQNIARHKRSKKHIDLMANL